MPRRPRAAESDRRAVALRLGQTQGGARNRRRAKKPGSGINAAGPGGGRARSGRRPPRRFAPCVPADRRARHGRRRRYSAAIRPPPHRPARPAWRAAGTAAKAEERRGRASPEPPSALVGQADPQAFDDALGVLKVSELGRAVQLCHAGGAVDVDNALVGGHVFGRDWDVV